MELSREGTGEEAGEELERRKAGEELEMRLERTKIGSAHGQLLSPCCLCRKEGAQ